MNDKAWNGVFRRYKTPEGCHVDFIVPLGKAAAQRTMHPRWNLDEKHVRYRAEIYKEGTRTEWTVLRFSQHVRNSECWQ